MEINIHLKLWFHDISWADTYEHFPNLEILLSKPEGKAIYSWQKYTKKNLLWIRPLMTNHQYHPWTVNKNGQGFDQNISNLGTSILWSHDPPYTRDSLKLTASSPLPLKINGWNLRHAALCFQGVFEGADGTHLLFQGWGQGRVSYGKTLDDPPEMVDSVVRNQWVNGL